MEIPSEIQQQILKVRRDNPTLTANMSDEDILELFRQADQAIANDRPTAFIVRTPKDTPQVWTTAANHDFEKQSLDELVVVGQQLVYKGQWQEAEQAFRILLTKAYQSNNILYQCLALMFQGRLYSDRGDQQHALGLFLQALSMVEYTDDPKLVSSIHDGMGIAYKNQGKYKEAIEHHNFAIEIQKRIGDTQGTIISQANLGNVHLAMGNYEQATSVFKNLLDYAIRTGAEQASAQAYCNLGIVYHRQGLLDLAIEMQSKSLEIALRLGDPLTAAKAYGNLGIIHTEQCDYPAAVQMVRKALEFNVQLGIEPDVAKKYADLASLYSKMGEPILAFLNYDQALGFYNRIGDRDSMAKIHFNMGNLYQLQGKSAQASEQFQKAQVIFESIGEFENAEQAARHWRQ
jgi:tetratricopeptide (TPR) repeat protein